LIFEEHWSKHKLPYPVILLGPMVQTTLEFARSQLEWMNESLVKLLGHSRENPFLLRHVKLCASLAEYRRLPISGPRVVLAVDASLNAGPARNLLVEWASNPKSLIILPSAPPPTSWASQILTMAELRDAKVGFGSSMPRLEVSLSKRVALKGQELEEYRKMKEEQRRAAEAALHTLTVENMDTDEIKKQGHRGESPTGDGGRAEFIRKPGRKSRGSVGSAAMGESPRSSAFYQQPTRANVMSIGHAARDSTGVYMDVDDAMSINPIKPDSFDLELDDLAPEDAGACLIEGFDLGYGAVAPIFPNEDEWEQDAALFDEYGAPVDLAALAGEGEDQGRLGRALASEAEAERGEFALPLGDGEGKGHEDITPERDIPTKIETTMVPLDLAAKIIRLDLDGRADDRSVRNILTHIAPQNIILVHAEEESLGAMARRLETELEGLHTSVKISMAGEPVTVGLGSSYEVQLSEDIMDAIEMHAVGGYELGWVNGKLDTLHDVEKEGESLPVLHSSKVTGFLQNTEQNGNAEDQLTTTTAVEGRNDAAYGGVFIGDVRLSELKKALATAGVLSEFHGGGLFCQGNVVIRRHGDAGGLLLEGVVGEEYYKVRDIIYGQYHIC
jgi:Cft2 family RNA processing exonuclease